MFEAKGGWSVGFAYYFYWKSHVGCDQIRLDKLKSILSFLVTHLQSFVFFFTQYYKDVIIVILPSAESRAGNSLIWFPSESLVFCPKMSEWAIHWFAHFWWAKWAICSHRLFLLSDLSKSLKVTHFWWTMWANWAIHSHNSPKKWKWAKIRDSVIFSEKKNLNKT